MSSARTLLVIEDNPGDARLLCEMLAGDRKQRDELIHVGTMIDAETHLAHHAVDVVLLDLGLPDSQGLAAIRRIRAALQMFRWLY
jgi:CheY-like chemotaxis protein